VVLITSTNVTETLAFAREFAPRLRPGSVVALCGDLGTGKTHFVKGLAEGLGYIGDVTSPTFTIIHEYLGGLIPLYHFDLYRIEQEDEAVRAGIEDYLGIDGVCAVEWADKFPSLMPRQTRWLDFRIESDGAHTISERL
jgi:tRNA threonylcarbamoyladenosine biosynthesis protein TsaE